MIENSPMSSEISALMFHENGYKHPAPTMHKACPSSITEQRTDEGPVHPPIPVHHQHIEDFGQ